MENRLIVGQERPGHVAAREALLDRAMGPIRFRRASEKLRAGRRPVLGFVAHVGHSLVGTVRLWSVAADGIGNAVLLGPLAVDNDRQNLGVGSTLMQCAIERAAAAGHEAVVLVGDPDYYRRFGFSADKAAGLAVPGPFERHRMLGLALVPGALDRASGVLRPTGALLETDIEAPALAGVA